MANKSRDLVPEGLEVPSGILKLILLRRSGQSTSEVTRLWINKMFWLMRLVSRVGRNRSEAISTRETSKYL